MDTNPPYGPIYLIKVQYLQSRDFFVQEYISFRIIYFTWYLPILRAFLFLVSSVSTCTTYHCANNFPVCCSPMMNIFSSVDFPTMGDLWKMQDEKRKMRTKKNLTSSERKTETSIFALPTHGISQPLSTGSSTE